MKVSNQLKTFRIHSGYSQSDVAKKLNISRQSISKWENNRGTPDIDKLIQLSKLYETTLDNLVTGVPKTPEDIDIQTLPVENEATNDSPIFLILSLFSFILFPISFIIIPFIMVKIKKNHHFYKFILIITLLSLLLNLYMLIDFSSSF